MSCSRSCPVWAQTHRALPVVSPGHCQAQPCPNTRSPKQREPCARRGWHVPLVLPAAPLRSCDNRGHQRPLLRRAVPCPGRAGLLPAVRTRGRKEPASPAQPAPPVRGTAARPRAPGRCWERSAHTAVLGMERWRCGGKRGAGRAHAVSLSESSLCASCLAGPDPVICTPTEVTETWNLRLICSEMVQVRGWARVSPALQRSSASLTAARRVSSASSEARRDSPELAPSCCSPALLPAWEGAWSSLAPGA